MGGAFTPDFQGKTHNYAEAVMSLARLKIITVRRNMDEYAMKKHSIKRHDAAR